MREYKNEVPVDPAIAPDMMTLGEFLEAEKMNIIKNDDGSGFWVKDGKESMEEVFSSDPEDATHVAWYAK